MTTESTAPDAFAPIGDALDDDFEPRDPVAVALEYLVHGRSRRDLARDFGMTLSAAHQNVAQAVREHVGGRGTAREAYVVLHAGLDDVTQRVYEEMARDRETIAPLLGVLVDVHRLRAALLATGPARPRDEQ